MYASFPLSCPSRDRLGHPEVEDPGDPVDTDHHVLRADVAVHHPEGLPPLVARFVRGVEPVQGTGDDGADHRDRQRRAARQGCPREAAERLPLDVLHHEEDLALGGDDVERLHDVGVVDARDEARLVQEHRDELGLPGHLGVQPLDGDGPREADRGQQASDVHRAHAAGRDLVVKGVTTDHPGDHVRGRL
jgi:hypothetical protein